MIWVYDNFHLFLAEAFIRYIAYDKFSQNLDSKSNSNTWTSFELFFIPHFINLERVNIIYHICRIYFVKCIKDESIKWSIICFSSHTAVSKQSCHSCYGLGEFFLVSFWSVQWSCQLSLFHIHTEKHGEMRNLFEWFEQMPNFHLNYVNINKHGLMIRFSSLELNISGHEFSLCCLTSLMF